MIFMGLRRLAVTAGLVAALGTCFAAENINFGWNVRNVVNYCEKNGGFRFDGERRDGDAVKKYRVVADSRGVILYDEYDIKTGKYSSLTSFFSNSKMDSMYPDLREVTDKKTLEELRSLGAQVTGFCSAASGDYFMNMKRDEKGLAVLLDSHYSAHDYNAKLEQIRKGFEKEGIGMSEFSCKTGDGVEVRVHTEAGSSSFSYTRNGEKIRVRLFPIGKMIVATGKTVISDPQIIEEAKKYAGEVLDIVLADKSAKTLKEF